MSINMTVPSNCRHATKSLSWLVMFIVFSRSYSLSCTYAPKFWHWFVLISPPAFHILFLGTEFVVDSSDVEILSRCVGIPPSPHEWDTKFPKT